MSIKPVKIRDFKGGLNLNDANTIADNELSIATNMYYDNDKRLTVRRGQQNFGGQLSDAVALLNACNATTNFVASDDAANIAGGTAIRGTASVEFDVDVSVSANNYATVTNASLGTVDCSLTNGLLKFWLYVPASFNTDLTDVKVRLGSDSSNYHEWTLATLTEASNNLVNLNFDDATDTGSPNDASVDYFRIQITYAAGYTDKLNLLIDSIYCYSNTFTKGTHSIHFWEDADGDRRLIAGCGTNLYQYDNVANWDVIKTGMTDNLLLSFAAYADVLSFTNGTDNYMDYDGIVVAERTGADTIKGKYLITANDVGYIAGLSTAPSVLYYTNSTPANLQTFPNSVDIEEDNGQIITGLANLGPIVLVFKEKSIYDVNIATPSRQQLDYSGGSKAHRSIARVENDIYFYDTNGVATLAQREGTTGSLRATPITANLQPLIDVLRNIETNAAIYWEKTNQYYLAVDSNNSGFNDAVLVYDTLTKAWTTWTGINANDFTIYVDSDGLEHLLYASEYSGRVVELETGYNDNEVEISTSVGTKQFDFDEPSLAKEYREYDIIGYISQSAEITATAEIDGADVTTDIIYGSTYAGSSDSISLGVTPIGTVALTGGDIVAGEITLNAFKARLPVYQTGVETRIKLSSNKKNTAWVLNRIQIVPESQSFDYFPNNEIL